MLDIIIMKIKTIIFASVMLVGCQAIQPDASTQHRQDLSPANQRETGKILASQSSRSTKLDYQKDDLWSFIGNEMKMDIPDKAQIRQYKKHYLNDKSYLHDVTSRAEPYMYWIVEQIKQRDMPMELVLLPIVESAFNPHATSPAKAAGLWQIVPQTGRNYGLKQNKWYDGRRDVAASTTAALDILERLNRMFDGDWLLTIAAYNSGEGRVLQAVKKNQAKGLSTNFWALPLPKETINYIPKMLALSDIIKNRQRYKVLLPDPNTDRALARIEVGQQIELSQAAYMAGMSLTKLKSFNSGYIRNVTAPNGPHYIMLPKKHASQFKNSLAETDITLSKSETRKQFNSTNTEGKSITYRVRKGDSLSSIAKRHDVKISDVMRWNRVTTKNNLLQPGDTLTLFVGNRPSNES